MNPSKSINQKSSLNSRIKAFAELGQIMRLASESYTLQNDYFFKEKYPDFSESLQSAGYGNPWFTPSNIAFALKSWCEELTEVSINKWVEEYTERILVTEPKRVAVIMAGNIPFVGFHDFFCTIIAGHSFIGKLSSDDKILLPAIAKLLISIDISLKEVISFTETRIENFDAIIATGSNNTARYFEYYFSKYPHIIRKSRNGVAVLDGSESDVELELLGTDICSYFGLGCRNVSKVFIPQGFPPEKLFICIQPFVKALYDHYKYMNNYSYYRSIYLLNNTLHLDNGLFIVTESEQYSSPIPVLNYQRYSDIDSLRGKLELDSESIQCITSQVFTGNNVVPLGRTQHPGLSDYADGIDTMKFLLDL